MNFYLNENYLVKSTENEKEFISSLKEIKELYDFLNKKNYKMYIKDNLDIDYKQFSKNRDIMMNIPFLSKIHCINTSCNMLNKADITPEIDNYYFVELVSLCYRDNNELVLSLKNEDEAVNDQYVINKNNTQLNIENIIGRLKLQEYCQHNPAPQSASEVFERAENEFSHIKFTKIAFDSVKLREDILKQFGFNNLFDIFKAVEEIIYPFYNGNSGTTIKEIFNVFKEKTGLECSDESDATMNKYGSQREATIKGEKVKMRYHIKIKNDVRIYFKYSEEDDCIYIGHSGKHLSIASKN